MSAACAPAYAGAQAVSRFFIEDHFTIADIPQDAREVKIWLEMPLEETWQKVSDLKIQSPLPYKIKKDAKTGNRFIHISAKDAKKFPADITVAFAVERKGIGLETLNSRSDLTGLGQYLEAIPPNIPVDEASKKLALSVVGEEKNRLAQARKIYDFIQDNSVYYRKEPQRLKPSGTGSALYCLNEKTGNCTDFHALFMSLGRSLGIPTEFVMGSYLSKEKEGKEDPAYHCWAKFFDEQRGWVYVDAAYGNLWPEKKDFYFGRLDSTRIAFTQGRHINLAPKQKSDPLNYFVYGYLEVDGKPQGKIQRKLIFNSI